VSLRLAVDRDSVAAGDDCESHRAEVVVEATCTVTELVAAARRACPLAGIQGGKATWIVDVGGAVREAIAVVAEQWLEPKLLIASTTNAATLFTDREPAVFFRYWCQADPDAVFTALRDGRALPSRYG
jgi:hypothetical protein